ncbi:hypothetical protein [Gilvimarinus sp. 1_MG-2023]|uniref:hypothetical protein n=1 Tax=Gilvimarinus sp. 1_MG-2023 TaxID=3062638 RepID=UPI0026E2BBFF|nr:hypothetical protein [Gilvimarinus sp. 1_MG-2023]MDO6747203.1 hypothetical protein [Gilvimarinus sp. 1_MG-2023]
MELFILIFKTTIEAAFNTFVSNWIPIAQTVASCTIAIFAGLGTRAAYKGLNSWKIEHDGRSKLDAAKKIMIILDKFGNFPTALSSQYIALHHFQFPSEGQNEPPTPSTVKNIQLDKFIDLIEDENKFKEYVTLPDKLNKMIDRHTVTPLLHESLSKTIEGKISVYKELKEKAYSDVLDASITINEEIKSSYEELLRILENIFTTYKRTLVILDPEKEEAEKAIIYEIIYNKLSLKDDYNERRKPNESYMSGLVREFQSQKNKIEKLAMEPLKARKYL